MLKNVARWLNSSKDYQEGVSLYAQFGTDSSLLDYFKNNGKSKTAEKQLFSEIKEIYYKLKNKQPLVSLPISETISVDNPAPVKVILNPALEEATKQDADKAYKILMNLRAKLFHHCSIDPDRNENSTEIVKIREKLAFEIIGLQHDVQNKYNIHNHVKVHGALPIEDAKPEKSVELKDLSPILLERKRVNLLKLISRKKRTEATPKIISDLQAHELELKSIMDAISRLQ